uniref:Uncharacterized protein n=1 Tax=Mycena chlorophos TaxID=658473 RepID=A0ABQ0LAE6_MYCCL|nr:predicted protein [Mycena chlorophos]
MAAPSQSASPRNPLAASPATAKRVRGSDGISGSESPFSEISSVIPARNQRSVPSAGKNGTSSSGVAISRTTDVSGYSKAVDDVASSEGTRRLSGRGRERLHPSSTPAQTYLSLPIPTTPRMSRGEDEDGEEAWSRVGEGPRMTLLREDSSGDGCKRTKRHRTTRSAHDVDEQRYAGVARRHLLPLRSRVTDHRGCLAYRKRASASITHPLLYPGRQYRLANIPPHGLATPATSPLDTGSTFQKPAHSAARVASTSCPASASMFAYDAYVCHAAEGTSAQYSAHPQACCSALKGGHVPSLRKTALRRVPPSVVKGIVRGCDHRWPLRLAPVAARDQYCFNECSALAYALLRPSIPSQSRSSMLPWSGEARGWLRVGTRHWEFVALIHPNLPTSLETTSKSKFTMSATNPAAKNAELAAGDHKRPLSVGQKVAVLGGSGTAIASGSAIGVATQAQAVVADKKLQEQIAAAAEEQAVIAEEVKQASQH